jgi:hypothetical protein
MMKIAIKVVYISVVVLIVMQYSTTFSHAKIDPQTIVGVWLFDEGKGDVAKDMSGNKNNGKVVGAEWVKGKIGMALAFDGSSQLEITASASTDKYVDGFTYLLSIMPTGNAPNDNTRLIERDWHNPTIQIGAADFYGSTMVAGDQAASNVRGGKWAKNEWSFVALTWDGSVLSLYVNDQMVKDIKLKKPDFSKNHANGAIWLARWKGGAGWDYIGVIDEVGVFSTALNLDDLKSIMVNGLDKTLGLSPVSAEGKLTATWGDVKK